MTDSEWSAMIGSSPEEAYRTLIDQYGGLVYAIVMNKLNRCASREDIEDCVSDIFVELYGSMQDFSASKGSLRGFVSGISKRRAVDAFRRLSYRNRVTSSIEDETVKLPSSGSSTEEESEKRIFRQRLWKVVKSLGEPDSTIIIYQYFYDLPVREIAKRLSMTSGAVQKRSIRARKRVGEILRKDDDHE